MASDHVAKVSRLSASGIQLLSVVLNVEKLQDRTAALRRESGILLERMTERDQ